MKWNWRTYLCQMHLGRQFLMLFVYIVLRIESLMDVCPSCFTEFFIHFTTKSSIHNRQMTKVQKIGFIQVLTGSARIERMWEILHCLQEKEHLQRFSLNWELHDKHLFQNVIYSDPVVQNSVPMLITQLRWVIISKYALSVVLASFFKSFEPIFCNYPQCVLE